MNKAPLRTEFDSKENRWIFFVPFALPDHMLNSAKNYVFKINKDRWLGATGEFKNKIGIALRALEENKVVQHIVTKGDVTIFQSTEKMHPERLIVDLGSK